MAPPCTTSIANETSNHRLTWAPHEQYCWYTGPVRVPCPVRDLINMVDIISINSRRTLFPLSGADNTALGPFYLVLLLYKNKSYLRSKSG
jgi:hypothetical protein